MQPAVSLDREGAHRLHVPGAVLCHKLVDPRMRLVDGGDDAPAYTAGAAWQHSCGLTKHTVAAQHLAHGPSQHSCV